MWKSKMCCTERHPMGLPSSSSSFEARWSAYLRHPRQMFAWPVLINSWLTSLHKSSVYRLRLLCLIPCAEMTQIPDNSFDVLEDFLFPCQHFLISIKQTQRFQLSKSELIVIIWNLLLSSKHYIVFKGGYVGRVTMLLSTTYLLLCSMQKGKETVPASAATESVCLPPWGAIQHVETWGLCHLQKVCQF